MVKRRKRCKSEFQLCSLLNCAQERKDNKCVSADMDEYVFSFKILRKPSYRWEYNLIRSHVAVGMNTFGDSKTFFMLKTFQSLNISIGCCGRYMKCHLLCLGGRIRQLLSAGLCSLSPLYSPSYWRILWWFTHDLLINFLGIHCVASLICHRQPHGPLHQVHIWLPFPLEATLVKVD